jgi:PAS domain S-box-containing protein
LEISSSHTRRAGDPELPASEEMRRLLGRAVAASSNGIVITDPRVPDNPIVYVNPAFEEISGYTADEVMGRNCRFLQADDREQPALDELREALTEARECRVVLRNYRKDGTPFWNELYVSPVHDEEGRLTNFVGVQNDITQRRRMEEERDLLLVKEQLARAEAVEVRRRLALLAAAGPSLAASLDYEETLEGITRLLVPELADWCLLDIVEDDGSVNQLAAAHAEEEKEEAQGAQAVR